MRKDPNDRKQTITVGLKRKTIKAVDEAAAKDGRSRSEYIQRILDKHFQPQSTPMEHKIPFKMR
jgi:metal-responsive CopG/Arc/MetJ family transcriptional regulator